MPFKKYPDIERLGSDENKDILNYPEDTLVIEEKVDGGNASNLDFALSKTDPYEVAKEILRGHPFLDGNKRTALMVILIGKTDKSYDQLLKDYYDIFQSLAR